MKFVRLKGPLNPKKTKHLMTRYTTLFRLAVLTILAVALPLITITTPAQAKANKKYASLVMDADTGMILHQRNANKSLHPASLTKIMTLLLLFEEIQRGNIRLKDRIYISNHAASMVPSKLNLPVGSSIRVKDAIYALSIKSANDVAAAVAEHIGGTEATFARMMTRRAHELGMSRTYFKNASGLHNKYQISTARDMAKLARYIIKTHPQYYARFSRKSFSYGGKTYKTHNKLMKTYAGMDGMKTGYISASGFNLVASAKRNDRRLIGVVFGGRTSKSRNAHMASLLDKGFKRIGNIRVASVRPFKAPKPERKPNLLVALEALNSIATSTGANATKSAAKTTNTTQTASISPTMQNGMFAQLMGEGDRDPDSSSRIETGLMAIAAHQGTPPPRRNIKQASYVPTNTRSKNWTIQVGAYKSRAQAEQTLIANKKILPVNLRAANAHIAPLKTKDGWLFRSRIGGYDKISALNACRILKHCITIPPK